MGTTSFHHGISSAPSATRIVSHPPALADCRIPAPLLILSHCTDCWLLQHGCTSHGSYKPCASDSSAEVAEVHLLMRTPQPQRLLLQGSCASKERLAWDIVVPEGGTKEIYDWQCCTLRQTTDTDDKERIKPYVQQRCFISTQPHYQVSSLLFRSL
jgi:hypothetical protein